MSTPPRPPSDYLTEDDLRDRGIDPDLIATHCPGAVELTGLGGVRCWAIADLAPLLDGGPR